jgi:nucleotide-binding universal stress UspA family protein
VQAQSQLLPVAAQIDTVVGPAADSIIDYADRHDVDLIVVSSHAEEGHRSGGGKSVARKVARQARCDTLIVG